MPEYLTLARSNLDNSSLNVNGKGTQTTFLTNKSRKSNKYTQ